MNSLICRVGFFAALVAIGAPLAEAQRKPAAANIPPDLSFLTPEVNEQLESQSGEFYKAVAPAVANAAQSTVWIRSGKRVLALGTVVGDGSEVLTKWSEVAQRRNLLEAITGSGEARAASVVGVYADYDLARLKIDGAPLTPLALAKPSVPPLGSFLVAARPDKVPVSVGVAGVMPRSLREADRAFLGVTLDRDFDGNGAKVASVNSDGPAAAAGIKPGDIILGIGDKSVGGTFELQNRLLAFKPGDTAELRIRRQNSEKKLSLTLAPREEQPAIPRQRLDVMERMGGEISRVRGGFPQVLETDMFLKPNETGGPVVDLDGNFVGITLARASRVRSFIIPAASLTSLLDTKPLDPQTALATLPNPDGPELADMPLAIPEKPDTRRVLRDLSEVRRLMNLMDRELQRSDRGR